MRLIGKITATVCALVFVISLCACAGDPRPVTVPEGARIGDDEVASLVWEEEGEDGEPSIVIEMGDAEGIRQLAKVAQSFDITEGTTARIYGIFLSGSSVCSVQEPDGNGGYVGISLFIDGDWMAPVDGTEIDVTGKFTKGQYFMEFHADPSDIYLSAPESEPDGESGEEDVLLNSWIAAESDMVTPEREEMFKTAVTGIEGYELLPVRYIGSQTAEGTNHCFIANATETATGRECLALVYIHESPDGTLHFMNACEMDGFETATAFDPEEEDFGSYCDYSAAAGF